MISKYKITQLGAIMILFLLASCNGEKESTRESQNTLDNENKVDVPPEPNPAPAPGSAVVQAFIQSIDSTANAAFCTIKVEEVTAYGAGTPALAKGSTLKIEVPPTVLEKNKKELVAENKLLLHIASAKNIRLNTGSDDKDSISWKLISIK